MYIIRICIYDYNYIYIKYNIKYVYISIYIYVHRSPYLILHHLPYDSSSHAIAIESKAPRQAPWIVSVNFSARRSSVRAPRSVRSTLWTASIAWTSKPIPGEAMQHLAEKSPLEASGTMKNRGEIVGRSWGCSQWSGFGLVLNLLVTYFQSINYFWGWVETKPLENDIPPTKVDTWDEGWYPFFWLDMGYGNSFPLQDFGQFSRVCACRHPTMLSILGLFGNRSIRSDLK